MIRSTMKKPLGVLNSLCIAMTLVVTSAQSANADEVDKRLLWGDTHLHTKNSFDAFLFQNRSIDPDTAYRYARGVPVIHPFHRARVQIETPLDFLVVSDHAELMAIPRRIMEDDPQVTSTLIGRIGSWLMDLGFEMFAFKLLLMASNSGERSFTDAINSEAVRMPPWKEIISSADRNNIPGEFTAFIGWEWSSQRNGENLHRIVITDGDSEQSGRFLPLEATANPDPESLWSWLAITSASNNQRFVAIPHNMNISKGAMFAERRWDGSAMDAEYAKTRMRWEPIVEITQIKGDSETHADLSPNDEFASFETYRFLIDTRPDADKTAPIDTGSYVRPALKRGLEIEAQTGLNPYKFGLIGSTDSHTGLSSAEETNFHGKMALDSVPERKNESRLGGKGATGWDMSASGLAAVWASDNTRADILDAFKRRETYATTGPRIAVRLFAGHEFEDGDQDDAGFAQRGFATGVPMGGELDHHDSPPRFIIRASRDPVTAGLDRIQIVKGWLDANGMAQEKVYNVAASDGREIGPDWSLPPIQSTVDMTTAEVKPGTGAAELSAFWQDPDFRSDQAAFYYARVLQVPTPRHSLLDSIALGQNHISGHPPTIQERAYTSRIWYNP